MRTQTEKLVTDVKVLVSDTEELVRATASQAGEKIVDIRNRVQETVTNVKPQLAHLETVIVEQAKTSLITTGKLIRENPWNAIGISAAVGLIIGILIGRR